VKQKAAGNTCGFFAAPASFRRAQNAGRMLEHCQEVKAKLRHYPVATVRPLHHGDGPEVSERCAICT
jgi:hypothetical protein